MRPEAIVCWSGGKDCALALWRAREAYDVRALVCTVTETFDRISMHGVRGGLLRQQARALGIPLIEVPIPYPCTNDDYEMRMRDALRAQRQAGVVNVICGDLFLADVRQYREERLLGPTGCRGVFPLWNEETRDLAREFIEQGFRAVLCCVDTQAISADFAGRAFDASLLADLPAGVDPCGENGEFHTFVWDGPNFAEPVLWSLGEKQFREERFAYRDLVPSSARNSQNEIK